MTKLSAEAVVAVKADPNKNAKRKKQRTVMVNHSPTGFPGCVPVVVRSSNGCGAKARILGQALGATRVKDNQAAIELAGWAKADRLFLLGDVR